MKNKKYILIFIFLFSFFIAFAIAGLKLPYEQNKSLNITQGYDGVSHQKTDFYALDFGKECGEAYGLPVLASYTGKVITVSENHKVGETKSYGNFVLIDHGNNILSRYAHLKKVFVKEGENIVQGQQVGEIGNTGTIITSCIGETRGTHLHFAMYQKQTDGTFLAYKPEPISGFNNLVAGMTLASDNILVQKSQPQGLFSFLAGAFNAVTNLFAEEKPKDSFLVTTPESTIPSAITDVEHSVSNIAAEPKPENAKPESSISNTPTPNSNTVSQIPHMLNLTNTISQSNPPPYAGFGGGGAPPPAEPTTVVVSSAPATPAPVLEPEPEPPPLVDVVPPDISISIPECAGSLAADGCLLSTSTPLNILWSSAADDLDYFEFTHLINSGQAQTSTTTATSTIISVSDNSENIFSARAIDKAGNWSAPQSTTVAISSMPVVINEVAWAGTEASSTDEWIELYNRTNYPVNLQNWVLYSKTEKPYIILSGTISAHDYYLMERKDNETISDIAADLIYGNDGSSWALNNSGEILTLSYASTTIDQTVLCGAGPVWWCPGFNYKYRTMERNDPDLSGADSVSWGYNNGLIKNGKDMASQPIYGTPKARNSVNYLISNGTSHISSDITLTKAKSPYIVNNSNQYFQDNATLTIEPGAVIKFYNSAGLYFTGNSKIIAKGTAEEPIVFTSFEDDAYGGDLDNASTTPYAGGWLSVNIDTTNNDSVFDNTVFRYGGKYYSMGDYSRANLGIKNSSVSVSNSVFEYSLAYGLKLTNSNSSVSNNIFRNNNYVGDTAGINSAIYISGGSPQIKNNTVSQNGRGIYSVGSSAVIDSNVINSNVGEAIVSNASGTITNNSGSGNGTDGIVFGLSNLSATLKPNSLPYILNYNVSVASSTTLTIEPGVTVTGSGKFGGGRLDVYGNLLIQGIIASDVTFTSFWASSSPLKHIGWYGIRMYSGSSSNIKGATIGYAENGIVYENSPVNLENVKFENNNIAVKADSSSISGGAVSTSTIEFLNNTTNTIPSGLLGL